jgi:hypothetical protein
MQVVTSSEAGVVVCAKVNGFNDGGAQDAVRSSLNRVEERRKWAPQLMSVGEAHVQFGWTQL